MFNFGHGVFTNTDATIRAQIYSTKPVVMKGKVYQSTIRTADCAILADLPLCNKCKFGSVLRTSCSRWLGRLGKENH